MKTQGRLQFVDGLRGVAAMMVVFYHFWANLPESSRAATPLPLAWLFEHGNLGVDVFFVLSGFVIAHSLRNGDHTLRYAGRFALRRSIRLDPPLWLTIALELVLIRASLAVFPDLGTPIPGWTDVLANGTYAYRFLGLREVLPVFWSLTYEVQFYLVLVLGAVALQASRRLVPRVVDVARFVFAATVLYSFLIWMQLLPLPIAGIFFDRWFQFSLGVMAWCVATERLAPIALGAPATLMVLVAIGLVGAEYHMYTTAITCITAASLAYAGRANRMDWLSGSTFQFLGRISYSLYLLHLPIGWRAMSLIRELASANPGPLAGYVIMLVGIAASIVSSYAMFRLVESPSVNLARRVRLPKREDRLQDPDPGLIKAPAV